MKMKLILLLLWTTQISFGQMNNPYSVFQFPPIDSLIMGEWDLTRVEIVDGYMVHSDTNRFTSRDIQSKKLIFTADSIFNSQDSTLRYYRQQRHFPYTISYDSLARVHRLQLFAGKKRKLHEAESYEIVRCTTDELIIKSFQYLHDGIDYASFSIVHTYRKAGMEDLLQSISGEWYYCSDSGNSFLTKNDTITYEFARTPSDSLCHQSGYRIDLAFTRVIYENLMKFGFYSEYFGTFGHTRFCFDTKNELIYFLENDRTFVYHYELIGLDKLVLWSARESTQ